MANEGVKFTDLPAVSVASLVDLFCVDQNGVSYKESNQQVADLMLAYVIKSYPGNPNGNLAGVNYQVCWDTSNFKFYVCTTAGNSSSAVWTATSLTGLLTPAQGGTGVANPTANGIAISHGTSNFTFPTLANGQLLIGSTGNAPAPATITAGTNITITNTAGGIRIDSTTPGTFSFVQQSTSVTMIVRTGYITTGGSLVTLTLPTLSAVGDYIKVVGVGAGGWAIAQAAGQQITVGIAQTTSGAGGSLASSQIRDSISLVCTAANTAWQADVAPQGNITVV